MRRKDNFKIKLLSVVMPAYKQQKTIARDIKHIVKALDELEYRYEILVVVDGTLDQTFQRASKLKSRKVRVFGYERNQGKGHAIRYGMMHSKGDVIGFIDAGMDIHPTGLKMLLNHMEWYEADVIVGSKLHPVSKVDYPFSRTILSWGYRLLTRILFGFKVRDTQVGLKFFRRDVVRDVLPKLNVKRYAFDIEILAIAYSLGYTRIFEAPVKIKFSKNSIVSKDLWRTISLMVLDTFYVFYRMKLVRYYSHTHKKKHKLMSDKKMGVAVHINK